MLRLVETVDDLQQPVGLAPRRPDDVLQPGRETLPGVTAVQAAPDAVGFGKVDALRVGGVDPHVGDPPDVRVQRCHLLPGLAAVGAACDHAAAAFADPSGKDGRPVWIDRRHVGDEVQTPQRGILMLPGRAAVAGQVGAVAAERVDAVRVGGVGDDRLQVAAGRQLVPGAAGIGAVVHRLRRLTHQARRRQPGPDQIGVGGAVDEVGTRGGVGGQYPVGRVDLVVQPGRGKGVTRQNAVIGDLARGRVAVDDQLVLVGWRWRRTGWQRELDPGVAAVVAAQQAGLPAVRLGQVDVDRRAIRPPADGQRLHGLVGAKVVHHLPGDVAGVGGVGVEAAPQDTGAAAADVECVAGIVERQPGVDPVGGGRHGQPAPFTGRHAAVNTAAAVLGHAHDVERIRVIGVDDDRVGDRPALQPAAGRTPDLPAIVAFDDEHTTAKIVPLVGCRPQRRGLAVFDRQGVCAHGVQELPLASWIRARSASTIRPEQPAEGTQIERAGVGVVDAQSVAAHGWRHPLRRVLPVGAAVVAHQQELAVGQGVERSGRTGRGNQLTHDRGETVAGWGGGRGRRMRGRWCGGDRARRRGRSRGRRRVAVQDEGQVACRQVRWWYLRPADPDSGLVHEHRAGAAGAVVVGAELQAEAASAQGQQVDLGRQPGPVIGPPGGQHLVGTVVEFRQHVLVIGDRRVVDEPAGRRRARVADGRQITEDRVTSEGQGGAGGIGRDADALAKVGVAEDVGTAGFDAAAHRPGTGQAGVVRVSGRIGGGGNFPGAGDAGVVQIGIGLETAVGQGLVAGTAVDVGRAAAAGGVEEGQRGRGQQPLRRGPAGQQGLRCPALTVVVRAVDARRVFAGHEGVVQRHVQRLAGRVDDQVVVRRDIIAGQAGRCYLPRRAAVGRARDAALRLDARAFHFTVRGPQRVVGRVVG